jgi:hypothetical protein
MAKTKSNTPIILGVVIVLAIIGGYIASPESFQNAFNVGSGSQGIPAPVDRTGEIGTQQYEGSVTMNVVHRDALDSAEPRTEGDNLATTYYKLVGGIYKSIGSGTGNTIFVDPTLDRVFASVTVLQGEDFYVAPASTADPALNPRVKAFDFFDISGDGTKEYVFTIDVTGLKIQGGQTTPTIDLYVDSFDYSDITLDDPADQLEISTSSGTNVFVEWDMSMDEGAETANAQYEYELRITGDDTSRWDRGASTLTIPNMGTISLADFTEGSVGDDTKYTRTLGFGMENANYVAVPQNVQNKADINLKLVTNFGDDENVNATLTIRSITADQGTDTASNTIQLCNNNCGN